MAMGRKVFLLACAAALLALPHQTFVPAPSSIRPAVPVAAVAGTAAMLGAAPAHADEIGAAAKSLATAAYPFVKEIDWKSPLALTKPGTAATSEWLTAIDKLILMGASMDTKTLKAGVLAHHKAIGSMNGNLVTSKNDFAEVTAAIGRMIASVPESKTMDAYNALAKVVPPTVPTYLMSTVKEADAKAAYAALMNFKDVVKAHPITPAADTPASFPKIDAAAKTLAAQAYPFLKEVDWTNDKLYLSPPFFGAKPDAVVKAIDKVLLMGAAMDGGALKEGAMAHSKAIADVDQSLVTSQEDFEAINAGIGKMVASVPTSATMDVYNAFKDLVPNPFLPDYLISSGKITPADAGKAYGALMEFKDVVKAAR